MATRETLPVESEPYTKGYYMIWGVLSFAAIIYIAYLVFGSGTSPIIKISKVSEKSSVATLVNEQSRRIGSAMAIATRAADKSAANTSAIKSLEKRVQLLTWKMADVAPVTGVSNNGRSANDVTSLGNRANGYVKQVMGNSGDDSGIIGHVIAATSDNAKTAVPEAVRKLAPEAKRIVTTKVVKTVAIDAISSIAGVVDAAPGSGANIINPAGKNLGTLNPLKVAALAAGISKSTQSDTQRAPDASGSVQKAAVSASDVAGVIQPMIRKSPFGTMPLPVRKSYGVRLTSGKSVEALRLTWDLINEMNRPIMKGLTTRFVKKPSSIGMPYRLIAGPMVSTGQAQTLCAKLHKQNINCDVTVFQGRKL